MQGTYTIDLSLMPTTLDLWHVCLLATVLVLAFILIMVLLMMVISMARRAKKQSIEPVKQTVKPAEPEVKIVEKIVEVEVEKIVQAPAPEPIVLKESTPDAALQLLGLLQKEARFIDFIKENISHYSDADIGIAARVVHEGCNKVMDEYFTLDTVHQDSEGSQIKLEKGFDASQIRLTGNIVGKPPFTGTLVHSGWQVTDIRLPKLTKDHNAKIIAAAEVEL